jgi:four helix bundle protein
MKKDLENRLVDFSSGVIKLAKNLKDEKSAKILADQLIRSGTSSALNYGEAQNAQSKRDFVSKVSIVLKELRETHINLKIIKQTELYLDAKQIIDLLKENDELLAIFTATLNTSKKNMRRAV